MKASRLITRILYTLEFTGFYLFEVVASNLRVARDVLLPAGRMNPGFVRVNVEGMSERQLLALANLITMTPGTLSLDIIDGKELLVHSLYVEDALKDAKDLEETFKERICRVF
ncbi:MAG: Na+/H+ antiporter subunit E [Puniceicoccaceae bacterium]